jgi:hypothetical protein
MSEYYDYGQMIMRIPAGFIAGQRAAMDQAGFMQELKDRQEETESKRAIAAILNQTLGQEDTQAAFAARGLTRLKEQNEQQPGLVGTHPPAPAPENIAQGLAPQGGMGTALPGPAPTPSPLGTTGGPGTASPGLLQTSPQAQKAQQLLSAGMQMMRVDPAKGMQLIQAAKSLGGTAEHDPTLEVFKQLTKKAIDDKDPEALKFLFSAAKDHPLTKENLHYFTDVGFKGKDVEMSGTLEVKDGLAINPNSQTPIKVNAPDGTHKFKMVFKNGDMESKPIITGMEPAKEAKEASTDADAKKREGFEALYPQYVGKVGTPAYAVAFRDYTNKTSEKLNISVSGAEARGRSYANERFYSMFDTKTGQTIKVKGKFLNDDSGNRYLDPQDPGLKSDTSSLVKMTKGMDSVNAFEKGAGQALDYAVSVAKDFGVGKYPKANTVSQLISYNLGDPKVKGLKNSITTAATEYMKVINAGSDLTAAELSVMGQQRAKEIIESADNLDSLKNSVKIMQREMQISGDKFKAQRAEIQTRLKGQGQNEVEPKKITPRKPGETIAEYLRRTGGQ